MRLDMRLEGVGLGHRYRKRPWLFQDVHLSLEPGEILGVLGPSGSGKTTLGRILAGYESPLIGTVQVDGMPYPIKGYHPVQMVFQHPERAVNPRWKIGHILRESMRDLTLHHQQGGDPNNDDSDDHHAGQLVDREDAGSSVMPDNGWSAARVIEELGIARGWMDRRPSELSGGELQRICIARALAPGTRYLIADEMTTMLDAISQAQIWHVVLDVALARQMGILVISHDRHLLHRVCDRVQEWPIAGRIR